MMSINKVGSQGGMILLGIVLTLQNFYETLATSTEESSTEGPNCEEEPPDCTGWFDAEFLDMTQSLYAQELNATIVRYVQYEINSSSSQPVCLLKPFKKMPFHNASPMVLIIGCSETGTRVVLKPGSKHINSSLPLFLWVTNCVIYWKDISKLGQHVVLKAIQLFDWRDEFSTGKPEYFNACVHLNHPDRDLYELDTKRSIEGFTNIEKMTVYNTVVRTASPVFVRQLWSGLKILGFER